MYAQANNHPPLPKKRGGIVLLFEKNLMVGYSQPVCSVEIFDNPTQSPFTGRQQLVGIVATSIRADRECRSGAVKQRPVGGCRFARCGIPIAPGLSDIGKTYIVETYVTTDMVCRQCLEGQR